MRRGARIAAAIEIVEEIDIAWKDRRRIAVDILLSRFYKGRRYMGAKDRREVSSWVYFVLRNGAALEWHLEQVGVEKPSPRILVIAAMVFKEGMEVEELNGHLRESRPYSAKTLSRKEKSIVEKLHSKELYNDAMPDPVRLNYPEWLHDRLIATFGEDMQEAMLFLNEEAKTHLRVNTLRASREQVITALEEAGIEIDKSANKALIEDGLKTSDPDTCLRLKRREAIFSLPAFKKGWFEVQDEGSQILASLVKARAGEKVIDFCAGAGGKTLAIAAGMNNKGRILAWDTSDIRLEQMTKRLARAGVDNVQRHLLRSENDPFIKRHKSSADWVLVDVPCSGSGTWRRNPDMKWRLSLNDMTELKELQRNILKSAARLPKVGGRLVYATCSLFTEENEEQIENFLKDNGNYELEHCGAITANGEREKYLKLLPHKYGTDGFFAAILRHI